MEITNVCPYCGKEMLDGAIPCVRDGVRWCQKKQGVYGDYYEEGMRDGVLLGKPDVFSAGYAPAYYCEGCRAVIVPVPGIETFAQKAGRWLDKTVDAWNERIDRAAERREEEENERKREERRKKDPWEV